MSTHTACTPLLDLPISWQQSDGLTLHFLPKRQPLHKFAPEPTYIASLSLHNSPMGLAARCSNLCRQAERMENDSRLNRGLAVIALDWVATPSSLRATVAGGSYITSPFIA